MLVKAVLMLAFLVYLSPEFVFMLHTSSHAGHITAACITLYLIILIVFSEIFTGYFIYCNFNIFSGQQKLQLATHRMASRV
jgi:positive regulator of sigma E activity